MKLRRKTNQINFRESILIQLREGGVAFALDTDTNAVLQFTKLEAQLIKTL